VPVFWAVCAHELKKKGKKVLVIEKREHIAGNAFTEIIMEFMFIAMVLIYFILIIETFGIM
jgi:UDP-galactopyranose mutase